MASMRDIKRRIKSVNSTQQITKAMNLVASSKLQRARARLEDTKEYFNATTELIAKIVNSSNSINSIYFSSKEAKKSAFIVITGDRGLCGGYNINVCKEALTLLDKNKDVSAVTIGSKAKDYFNRRKVNIINKYSGISESPHYEDAKKIGAYVLDLYVKGEVDEVYIVYTKFISTLSHVPEKIKLLPIDKDSFELKDEKKSLSLNMYEPDEEQVLDYIVPKYVNTFIYGALVESSACELGARMTAMDSATENAKEMIDDLTLLFNRARQGAITQELTEIVSGANALD